MKKWHSMALLSLPVVAALLLLASIVSADASYRSRGNHPNHGYAGRWKKTNHWSYTYYYRPRAGTAYRYHYVYYYPKDSYGKKGYYYYYNTRKKAYWGRCKYGSTNYELLADEHQKATLEDIKDDWFKPQGKMTTVPDMEPATALLSPPEPPDAPPKAEE